MTPTLTAGESLETQLSSSEGTAPQFVGVPPRGLRLPAGAQTAGSEPPHCALGPLILPGVLITLRLVLADVLPSP